ncbi:MAG: SH3 domain-containing protein [Anaerolineae bacterium]|nr:SH3 domain-containing protein [Anaerolineae bacterium]MDW8173764.1 SH3 domain-containing protein [Anaerolineae bacterium]
MRYVRPLSIFFTLCLLLAGAGMASAQTFNAIVNTGKLNVRQGPAPTFPAIAQLDNRTAISLIGRNADATWVEISVGTVRGWVNARYIATAVNLAALPQTWGGTVVQPTPLPSPFVATVNTAFLNLRSGPGANFSILRKLARGQSMTLQGRNADARWVQVVMPDGLVGWVSARYLSMSVNPASLPLASTTGVTPGAPQPVPVGGQTGIVANVAALSVRLGPGVQFASFTAIPDGTGVSLIARSADGAWLLVQLADGRTGWVSSAFISTSFPLASLPTR